MVTNGVVTMTIVKVLMCCKYGSTLVIDSDARINPLQLHKQTQLLTLLRHLHF